MTAYNVVCFKVKPGQEQAFLEAHKSIQLFDGMMEGAVVKNGDLAYRVIGKWDTFDKLAAVRPKMVSVLDGLRGMLEDLGGGLGVTDPVSGETVVELSR